MIMLARALSRMALSLAMVAGTTAGAQMPDWATAPVAPARSALSRVATAERAIAIRLIRPRLGPLFQGESNSTADQAILSFAAERIRLGSTSGLIVQATGGELCSPTGNCAFWIIDLSRKRIVLDRGTVQGFAVLKASGQAPAKIITSMHGSAFESERILWRFNGSRYEAEKCAEVEYNENATKATPAVKLYTCSAEGNREE